MSMEMEQQVYFWEQKTKLSLTGGFKMKIAICDIDKIFLSKIKDTIYKYAAANRLEAVAECYVSGESIVGRKDYNLIFLGYDLKGKNGLKIAENLRERGISCPIIFVSDRTDIILEVFRVQAFGFILKSQWEQKLNTLLDDFFKKMGTDYPLWVKSGEDIICLNTEEVYYLEADNKRCHIHLKDKTLISNRTMARVFELMPKNHFVKTNRAFVVNLNHISRYNNEIITLKNGETLHPSRNYYKSFKEEYRRFLRPYII